MSYSNWCRKCARSPVQAYGDICSSCKLLDTAQTYYPIEGDCGPRERMYRERKEAMEKAKEREYTVTVTMLLELTMTITSSSYPEAVAAALAECRSHGDVVESSACQER